MFFDSERIARRKIEEAIEEGVFDNLPGKGQPLEMDDTPAHIRILKNANVPPDWIQMHQEIHREKAGCRLLWERVEKEYPKRLAAARSATPPPGDPEAPRRLFREWLGHARESYLRALRQVNHEILRFNMTAPAIAQGHLPFRIAEEEARFDAAFPGAPPAGEPAPEPPSASGRKLPLFARERYRAAAKKDPSG